MTEEQKQELIRRKEFEEFKESITSSTDGIKDKLDQQEGQIKSIEKNMEGISNTLDSLTTTIDRGFKNLDQRIDDNNENISKHVSLIEKYSIQNEEKRNSDMEVFLSDGKEEIETFMANKGSMIDDLNESFSLQSERKSTIRENFVVSGVSVIIAIINILPPLIEALTK